MRSPFFRVLKYEFLNIIRSRWVFFYFGFVTFLAASFLHISGSAAKALLTLSSVITVIIPLTVSLFVSFYWYNSERLTELLLTQPLGRGTLLAARGLALVLSLWSSYGLGLTLPFILRGDLWSADTPSTFLTNGLFVLLFGTFLTAVFTGLASWIAVRVNDRMRGVGAAFGLWFYAVLGHDALVLTLLTLAKEYPMDTPAAILTVLNPLGLTRVVLLVLQDASLLLGHGGALARQFLTGPAGLWSGLLIALLWVTVPAWGCWSTFRKRDL